MFSILFGLPPHRVHYSKMNQTRDCAYFTCTVIQNHTLDDLSVAPTSELRTITIFVLSLRVIMNYKCSK